MTAVYFYQCCPAIHTNRITISRSSICLIFCEKTKVTFNHWESPNNWQLSLSNIPFISRFKKIQVGNDQEIAKSERNSLLQSEVGYNFIDNQALILI